ncbi:MAG: ABC transporter ATP-binding protein [Chitinispirillaceae bacterium]|jgi:oligopeptide/dipeptide ABC transporter ATP-binding protein|nr:ABC transporter ATP-binding protein [Chitinispirillaceae bacterium]
MNSCLSVNNLHVSFRIEKTVAPAVRGVSFDIPESETIAIVGESGCGKSVTALSVMRLVPAPPGSIDSGEILFNDTDLLKSSEDAMNRIRGRSIAMIFQDPMTSLNPVLTCGKQISETIVFHRIASKRDAGALVEQMLSEAGIPEPGRIAASYPHQLSGGMRQRVMIAMALSCSPRLLIADEPTTALDVTVQATILDLLCRLQAERKMSLMLITHNLGIVGDIAHRVLVMYAGEVVENAPTASLFGDALHPYTQCLLETIPYVDRRKERLTVIPGDVPTPLCIPSGCPFHPRCPRVFDRCRREHPEITLQKENRQVRCFLYD